jgi:DNA-binding PucR family transcriptional regulator
VRTSTADRLAETLRSWLLHHGRREEVAADLVVHPQTVRYRMTQLRELYGDKLTDPASVLELTIALAQRSQVSRRSQVPE